jgi:hypothetical protein
VFRFGSGFSHCGKPFAFSKNKVRTGAKAQKEILGQGLDGTAKANALP